MTNSGSFASLRLQDVALFILPFCVHGFSAAAQTPIVFSDSTMATSDWTISNVVPQTANASLTVAQATGAARNTYRRVTVTWAGSGGNVIVRHLMNNAVFTPPAGSTGYAVSVSIAYHSAGDGLPTTSNCGNPTEIGSCYVFIRQGANDYIALAAQSVPSNPFINATINLSQFGRYTPPTTTCGASTIDLAQQPDLCAGTPALQFGFMTWKCSNGQCLRIDEIDDFSVTLTPLVSNGGQPNSIAATLAVNGVGLGLSANGCAAPGPHFVGIATPGPLTLSWRGPANAPTFLATGPLNVANTIAGCYGIVDIGTPPAFGDVLVLMGPTLNASGTASQTFMLPVLPPGPLADIQGLVLQAPTSSCPGVLTAAFSLSLL